MILSKLYFHDHGIPVVHLPWNLAIAIMLAYVIKYNKYIATTFNGAAVFNSFMTEVPII